jgi:diguanylate cyclase (GGDEF)-like protein/PAS domain S-box-containing protein
VTDPEARIISTNQAFTQVTGYSLQDVLGKDPSFQKSGVHDAAFYDEMWRVLKSRGQWQGEIWNRRKNGELYPAWENITEVKDDSGQVINYISVFSDITVLKETEKKLAHLAHHDPLTGLTNRLMFTANLAQAIERAQRHKQKLALLFLDLDRFKFVNDTYGHAAGDQVLQAVADRLKQSVRAQDMISRLGGDEFIILLEEISDSGDTAVLAQKIIDAISLPIDWQDQQLFVSASVGISIYPDDATDAEQLAKLGDEAMYRAKHGGRDRYVFYRSGQDQAITKEPGESKLPE